MNNHIHILAVPKKEDSLARGIGGINLIYIQYINRKHKRSGRLWQNRFYSTIVEKEPHLWTVSRYIERNPVRARLVARPEDYLWSSAKAHVTGVRDSILTGNWLGEKEINLLRKTTSTGRPLGRERFIKVIEKMLDREILPKKAGRPRKGK